MQQVSVVVEKKGVKVVRELVLQLGFACFGPKLLYKLLGLCLKSVRRVFGLLCVSV